MHPGETFEEWRALRPMGRAEFVARYAHPFLLRQKLRRTSSVPADDEWTERIERIAFATEVAGMDAGLMAVPPGRLRGARVVPVVKAPGNPFPDRISVGRAGNCDIPLKEATVSKLHAVLLVKGPGAAEIIDQKSANGTRVNGKALVSGTPAAVASGDTVIFGTIAVQFLDPGRLYDLF